MLTERKDYERAKDIYSDLEIIIRSARKSFLSVGVSFDVSARNLSDVIEERLQDGIEFSYVVLSRSADLQAWAPRFSQSVADLQAQVESSFQVLESLQRKFPVNFSIFATKQCPMYRIYIADRESDSPRGIIVFYGSATDSPQMPAVYLPNFLKSPFRQMYLDALKFIRIHVSTRVFVIHGHNEAKRRELVSVLGRLGVEPVVLIDQPNRGAMTIIEKFERYARECNFAIALLTPDDLVTKGKEKYLQPRLNTVFELGWFCAALGREHVILLIQGDIPLDLIHSDFAGVVKHRFNQKVEELYLTLQTELEALELVKRRE